MENENPHLFLFFFLSENSRFVENGNWNLVLWRTRIGDFFFCPRILVLWKTRIGEFFFLSENSRFVENGNGRILVLWKTRIEKKLFFFREFSFCGKQELEISRFVKNQNWRIFFIYFFFIREFSFCGNGAFSFCGKRELENSRFVENRNRRIFCFFFILYPRILVLWKRRILVWWKTRIGDFFFYPRILVLWKTGTREFSYCGKPESESFFFFLSENSRFVENGNWRILVL